MNILVGYTGFVGSNIAEYGLFDGLYNTKNIEMAYGTCPDLLVYAGLRAEKYLANSAPEKDRELIEQAEYNIKQINPRNIVLISTIDIFNNPIHVDEDTPVDTENLHAYGYNRYLLEQWTRDKYSNALIVRLPALFGHNLKKNFIFDFMNPIPQILTAMKMQELVGKENAILKYYFMQENGFYKVKKLEAKDKIVLANILTKIQFSALNFTDSRNQYQFYPLERLWHDINIALSNEVKLLHLATEPVSAAELYHYLTGEIFLNEIVKHPVIYDYRTKYTNLFGSNTSYIYSKNEIKKKIKDFIEEEQNKEHHE